MDSARMNFTDDTEDVALNFGDEDELASRKTVRRYKLTNLVLPTWFVGDLTRYRLFRHPLAVFFHMLFRVAAILAYLLCGWFSDSFIVNVVVIVVLVSMDFWTVKNITGRLLVGLRWWNYVDEDGKSHWVYESRKGASKSLITNTEARIFWLSLVVCQIFWIVFFFATIFTLKFKWFMVVCVGNILNGANLYGYIRCKIGSRKKLSSVASNFMGAQVFRSMLSQVTSSSSNSATTGATPS